MSARDETSGRPIDDETLMAFADGQLPKSEAEAIAAELARDPDLRRRLEPFTETRAVLADLFGPLADAPVPLPLQHVATAGVATSRKTSVLPFARRRLAVAVPYAVAASIAVAVAAPIAFLAGRSMDRDAPPPLALGAAVSPAIAQALDREPSGSRVALAGAMEVVATFRDRDGRICREFRLRASADLTAVACAEAAGWRVAVAVEGGDGAAYRPASGDLDVIDAWVESAGLGEPLSAEAEAAAFAVRKKSGSRE